MADKALGPDAPDDTPVHEAEISVRLSSILYHNGIKTFGAARGMSDAELLRLPNMGKVTLKELRAAFGISASLGAIGKRREALRLLYDARASIDKAIDIEEQFFSHGARHGKADAFRRRN